MFDVGGKLPLKSAYSNNKSHLFKFYMYVLSFGLCATIPNEF